MGEDDIGSVLTELNKGFQELRTLIITVGSILAMLMAGLNEVGFIDLAVDKLTGHYEDDNPFVEAGCDEDWTIIEDSYLVSNDITMNVRFTDNALCSYNYNATFTITNLNGDIWHEENTSMRNSKAFSVEFPNLADGSYRLVYELTDYQYLAVAGSVSYEVEIGSHDESVKVYGCTDYNATNYDSDATDEDGSCEYEEESQEDCNATIYDGYSYWAENNSSIYSEFDVDWSCQMKVDITVEVEVWDANNETLYLSGNISYETDYMDVDYNHVDFLNVTDAGISADADWVVHISVIHTDSVDDEVWVWVQHF
jgi:hypothetical protein